MQQRADHAGIRFVVLLIPKEYVFNKAATTCEHPDYLALVQHEKVFWEETRRSLAQENIEYIEALPALQAQLEKGPQPYQVHADGHPSRHGHRAIAQAVFDYLQEKNGN